MWSPNNKPQELQIEDLFDLEEPDTPRLSANGNHVVYVSSPRGKKGDHVLSSLWIADTRKEHSARQLTSGLFNDHSPEWSPDGTKIAFLSDRAKAGESSAVYMISIDGGEAYSVTYAENAKTILLFGWSPNGKFLAYASADEDTAQRKEKKEKKDDVKVYGEDVAYNRLRVLQVSTRKSTTLYEKRRHVSGATWSPDSKSLVYTIQNMPDWNSADVYGVDVEVVSLANQKNTRVLHFDGALRSPMIWIADYLYFLAGVRKGKISSSTMVYRFSMPDGDVQPLKHAYGSVECATSIRAFEGGIALKVESGLDERIEILGEQTSLLCEEATIDAFDIATQEDGTRMLVYTKNATNMPTELYSKTSKNNSMLQLSQHGQSIASHQLGTYHALHCSTFDGTTTLDGSYISPFTTSTTSTPEPLPTYVSIHGGPYLRVTNTFDGTHFNWRPPLLASGYGVLLPNYRGNSSRGDAFAAHADGGVGTVDYDDILAMVQEGIDRGFVDKERIVVGGWSQGGFLSYLAAVRNGKSEFANGKKRDWRFRAAVCGAGVTDWDMIVMTSDRPVFEAESAGIAPWAAQKDDLRARKSSAIWEVKEASESIPPILIVHGEGDERVPVSQALAFHRACLHHDIPCEFAVYPREPHILKERAHLVDMAERVVRFCNLHLG